MGVEAHAWMESDGYSLQQACLTDSYATYMEYSQGLVKVAAYQFTDLMDFDLQISPVPADDVESITSIRKVIAPGISLGALSPIAHETLSTVMHPNRRTFRQW